MKEIEKGEKDKEEVKEIRKKIKQNLSKNIPFKNIDLKFTIWFYFECVEAVPSSRRWGASPTKVNDFNPFSEQFREFDRIAYILEAFPHYARI